MQYIYSAFRRKACSLPSKTKVYVTCLGAAAASVTYRYNTNSIKEKKVQSKLKLFESASSTMDKLIYATVVLVHLCSPGLTKETTSHGALQMFSSVNTPAKQVLGNGIAKKAVMTRCSWPSAVAICRQSLEEIGIHFFGVTVMLKASQLFSGNLIISWYYDLVKKINNRCKRRRYTFLTRMNHYPVQ